MLTPSFDIRQDEQFVIVNIRVPYVKVSEAEFHINGCEFKFYCKPYFLRLNLPGQVAEDGREKAVFDFEKGSVTVHLPKLRSGEYFDNLGMLTTLLSKKPTKTTQSQKPLIEIIGANVRDSCSSESEDDFDWQAEQVLSEDHLLNHTPSLIPNAIAYGFANQHSGVFSKLQEEIPSIIDCPDPDHMTSYERRLARIAQEEISFSQDHYLADLMDNDVVDNVLKFEPAWKKELNRWKEMKSQASQNTSASVKPSKPTEAGQEIVPFSQSERDKLKDLPNKDYLLDKASSRCLYLGLIDIIFAFAYDHRTTEGEGNVESAWTVCKLSPTLSWLEVHRGSVHDVFCNFLRRSLCYPLYRHWQLTLTVLQDTRDIFRLGRRKLLQSLLSVHHALNSSEPYYVLNNLYLTDYCVWVQTASVRQIQSLADDLDEVCVLKESLGWELDELEAAAQRVLDGSTNSDSEQGDSSEDSSSGSSSTDESESDTSAIDESKPNCFDSEAAASKTDHAEQQAHNVSNGQQDLTLISPARQTTPSLLEQLVNLSIQNEPYSDHEQIGNSMLHNQLL